MKAARLPVPVAPGTRGWRGLRARGGVTGRGGLGGLVLLVALAVPTIVPVAFVLANSVNQAFVGQGFDFSLSAWQRAFDSGKTVGSVLASLLLSVRIPIAIAVAFGIAWLLIRVDLPGRKLITYALWFSFFLPVLPMAFGWILLADPGYGLLNGALDHLPLLNRVQLNVYSIPGILWVHLTLTTVPIITLLLSPALQQLDASYEEASDLAGASTLTTLRRITVPLVAPAILTAFIAGLIRSLEVFEVEQVLGIPSGIFVYSTRIYDLLRRIPPDYPQAMALSTLFLAALLIVALVYQSLLRRYRGNATVTGRGVRVAPRERRWWAWLATGVLTLAIAVGVGLPFTMLLLGSFTRLFGFFSIRNPWTMRHWQQVFESQAFLGALRNSLLIGVVVAVGGTLLYAIVAWVLVRSRVWSRNVVSLLVWLPWAIPGVLLGTAFLNVMLNTPVLAPLVATIVPLILVLVVQGLPLATQMLRTSIEQISKELEEASYMSGATVAATVRRITFPLVIPMLTSVSVLVFMGAVKDISATVLLASPGTRTLPLLMFEFASSGRLESAAVIGVLTAGLALLMTTLVLRMGARLGVEG